MSHISFLLLCCTDSVRQSFLAVLSRECHEAEEYYRAALHHLDDKLSQFSKQCDEVLNSSSVSAAEECTVILRLRRTAESLERQASTLRLFSEFNCESIRKATKKFDKKLRLHHSEGTCAPVAPVVQQLLPGSPATTFPYVVFSLVSTGYSFTNPDDLLHLIALAGNLRSRIDAKGDLQREQEEHKESFSMRRFFFSAVIASLLVHFFLPTATVSFLSCLAT